MNTAFKRTLLSTLVVPFAIGAASAIAQPIASWNYTVNNDLHNATFTTKPALPGVDRGTQSETDQLISWGSSTDSAERSSVGINDVNSGPVLTDGPAVNGGVFVHTNNIIDLDFDTLLSFDLTSTLTLNPIPAEAGDTEVLDPITFNTRFTETPNAVTPCADGGSTPCGDIFTVVSIEGLGDFTNGELPGQEFRQGNYIYTVFLELAGLETLPTAACTAAGDLDGICFGLLTPEDDVNRFQSSFRITAREVPEPGTLALLGMGLAGLGLSRRKKAAKA